jgi:hypothetical protein
LLTSKALQLKLTYIGKYKHTCINMREHAAAKVGASHLLGSSGSLLGPGMAGSSAEGCQPLSLPLSLLAAV